jgi:hypothetical protein
MSEKGVRRDKAARQTAPACRKSAKNGSRRAQFNHVADAGKKRDSVISVGNQ